MSAHHRHESNGRTRNRIAIEIHTASYRSTRGYTIIAALLDEISIWESDETSAEPDVEVINAIRPGMATIPGAMLLCASSPHARRGALWEAHRKHFGQDGDPVLVWQAATRAMNPAVPQSFIDAHMAEDPARARAEYFAEFRTDVETFISREVVDAAVVPGPLALLRTRRQRPRNRSAADERDEGPTFQLTALHRLPLTTVTT